MKFIDNATASVDVSWIEPTANADAALTSLTDLAYSSVYYQVGTGSLIVGAKITATKPAGGGAVATTLIVPAPSGVITKLTFFATATDTTGNESVKTAPVVFNIERIAPSIPTSFLVA